MGFTTTASKRLILAAAIAGLFGASATPAFADMETLLDKLHEKGVLSDDDYQQMRTEARADRRAEALKSASDVEKEQKAKSAATSTLKVPEALKSMELYGDLRLRYENRIARAADDTKTSEERQRWRYALRLGLRGDVSDDFFYGVRLDTGTYGRSAWVTMADDNAATGAPGTSKASQSNKSTDAVAVGLAFIGWKPTDWAQVIAGRQVNPLYTTSMVWDPDITPEGLSEKFTYKLGDNATLFAVAGQYLYSQVGKRSGQEAVIVTPNSDARKVDVLEKTISDAGHDREALKAQLADRDRMIAELRRQVVDQTAALDEMKSAQINLEHSLQSDQAEKHQVAQERSTLSQQMDVAQTSLQKTQAELDSLRQQRAQDQSRAESFEAQIRDLHGQLRDQEQEVGKQQELLAHDRDIRELMGARELYIAEVYDVARDGQTLKPYGRVFYTKGKSLIFYAYDLDQQAGLKRASTFQAWGSRGTDRQQATSLGVFYEDNAAKKRWVLKFDDPKKLEQINAVFVTVEPNGGSHKPSGKPLLFAYLKVDPNHP